MARFPLFGTSQKGRSRHVSTQRRLNLFAQINTPGDRAELSFHSTPGLALFSEFGAQPCRGAITLGNLCYVVHLGTLYSLNNAGVRTALGTLNTTVGRVDMAHNGLEIMIVDSTNGYTYVLATTTFAEITDAQFPDTVNTVDYQGGRFIFDEADSGQWGISASYDGQAYDASEFANAEAFPDDLVRVFVDHGEVLLFGSRSTEFWSNVGALDFPYAPVSGAVVEWGLAARWSVARSTDSVAFLAKNREGEVSVMHIKGYQPMRISNDSMDYVINGYSTVSDAQALTYKSSGHSFYQLNFPTAGKSWLFDFSTGLWSELEYGSFGARHRAQFGVEFINNTLAFDYENGNVYRIDADMPDDNGVEIVREIISRHIFDEETISIGRLWADFEGGLGNNPQAMLSTSRDGGHTWSPERWTTLGAVGEYRTRAVWWTLGQAYDFVMKIRVSGAAKCALAGAWVDAA